MPIENEESIRYKAATTWCRSIISSAHEILFNIYVFQSEMTKASCHLGYPFESLFSLLRNLHLIHIKRSVRSIRETIHRRINDYIKGKSILQLAKEANHPPFMMARIIVETMTNCKKKELTEAMRDPATKLGTAEDIPFKQNSFRASENVEYHRKTTVRIDPFSSSCVILPESMSRLAREVMDAIDADPIYGPRHDKARRVMGMEHEIMLEQALSAMKIPFETESQLRRKGTAKTPDILLSFPIAVKVPIRSNSTQRRHHRQPMTGDSKSSKSMDSSSHQDRYEWKVVCWMDSKALFGDTHTHNLDVLPQAQAFVHRFGPGLVLYWYGHAPLNDLDDCCGDVVVMGWNVPECVLLPNGEFASFGGGLSTSRNKVDEERS